MEVCKTPVAGNSLWVEVVEVVHLCRRSLRSFLSSYFILTLLVVLV
jgi:hypothetical protein